jgi:type II secretory pathway component GspD/PulD (secretin)
MTKKHCRLDRTKHVPYATAVRLLCKVLLTTCLAIMLVASAVAQNQPNAAGQAPQPGAEGIRFNLKGETSLTTLVEYISQRLNLRFIYDESLAQKKVVLQIPDNVPPENLFDLLQAALQINGLAIARTENPVWYRIVTNEKIPMVAVPNEQGAKLETLDRVLPVTQVFPLKRADPNQIRTLITPFLTTPGASAIPIPASKSLIVSDIAYNLLRIQRLIEILDADSFTSSIRFVKAQHVPVTDLAKQLEQILGARARTEAVGAAGATHTGEGSGPSRTGLVGIEIAVDERTNQLILVGLPIPIENALELLKSIDVPLATTTRTYRPRFLSLTQLEASLKTWVEQLSPRPPFETRVDGDALVIISTPTVLSAIEQWLPQVDTRDTSNKQSPIRFYKIKNVPVLDILDTLNSLQGGLGLNPFGGQQPLGRRTSQTGSRSRTTNDNALPGQNNPYLVNDATVQPGQIPPLPSAVRNGLVSPDGSFPGQPNLNGSPLGVGGNGIGQLGQPLVPFGFGGYGVGYPGYPVERGIQSPLGNAQVTADLGSNTLIIIAEPEVQEAYEKLIEFLDKRRPQVMIEARIVIIDTTDDYTLGVEVSGGDRTGSRKLFSFSSYGLSQVDPLTGSLTINPSNGFNATLVDPSTADVVVQALTTHRRARVLSAPKLLVDDNAEGTLESVNEVPFTSVNASQTVATTSFAGFAKAGTTISVTPTISEEKHVNLDYIVTLNSFTGNGSAGVPPPRQTNEIKSRVTVPDGYTIIVGGLTQKNVSQTLNGIPYLEKIPVIRELSSLTTDNRRDNSLFVFLRPIILEEDKFRDLRDLSRRAANIAEEGASFPASSPLLMK